MEHEEISPAMLRAGAREVGDMFGYPATYQLARFTRVAMVDEALAAIPGAGEWRALLAQAQAKAERQRVMDALLAKHDVRFTVWVDEWAQEQAVRLPKISFSLDVDIPSGGPKNRRRAGFTKSKHRGQPKVRRRMAAASRRRNRRKRI